MNTVADPVLHAERMHAERIAADDGSIVLDHRQLADGVRRAVAWLRDTTDHGDRVAVLAANSAHYLILYLAIPAGGRVIVPLNTRWAEPELAYALDDSEARLLITDRDAGGLGDHVGQVVPLTPGTDAPWSDHDPAPDLGVDCAESDLAGLFYTGGTTGKSKGVMLTHRNLVANTVHVRASFPSRTDDVYLIQAPMFHAAGSMSILDVVWNGATTVILDAYDPDTVLDLIESHRVTMTLGVPTMLAAEVEAQLARPRDVGSLRSYVHGGAPVAGEVLQRALGAFPAASLVEIYGSTELAPLATSYTRRGSDVDEWRPRSCGPPIMGVEVRIVGPDGRPGATDEIGTITARGPNVMAGYWRKPAQTEAVLSDGWYRSGDVGRLDADGFLYLHDRVDDVIVSGGENVYCTEVEEAIYRHPDVLEATVFGIPDEAWGEAVHAIVVPRPGSSPTFESLIGHCRSLIAGYKLPKSIDFITGPLPTSGPGKVLKRELRAPYWEGVNRSIN